MCKEEFAGLQGLSCVKALVAFEARTSPSAKRRPTGSVLTDHRALIGPTPCGWALIGPTLCGRALIGSTLCVRALIGPTLCGWHPGVQAQEEAIMELVEGNSVMLTTPTGSGKTLVATAAIAAAAARGEVGLGGWAGPGGLGGTTIGITRWVARC